MADRTCPDCGSTEGKRVRGLCERDYHRRKSNKTLPPKRKPLTPVERFWTKFKVDPDTGCWLWTASLSPSGYGQLAVNGRPEPAHRFSVRILHGLGEIPKGMHVDHICHDSAICSDWDLCRHRACVNPLHLSVVTPRENVMRSATSAVARNARKTHCVNGHEFTPENTFIRPSDGSRRCRACLEAQREGKNARRKARRAAVRAAGGRPT